MALSIRHYVVGKEEHLKLIKAKKLYKLSKQVIYTNTEIILAREDYTR